MAEQAAGETEGRVEPRWLAEIGPGGTGEGFLEKNLRHSLMFLRRPVNRLLVTFDNLSNVGDTSPDRVPWAFKYAQEQQLCHLGIMAHVSDWYRDAALIARMEALAGSGFFEPYERVIFAGVSMGGYASLAFGALVPGAHAIAINPQSTLDPDLVPWETRYENGRRQDWTLPLADAAVGIGGFGRVNLFHDPYHMLDQRHVDRLAGENVRGFHCWYSSHKTAVFLRKIDALKTVMTRCIFDELTTAEFYRLYRARRYLPWYRGALSGYFREAGRDELAGRIDRAFRARLRRKKRATAAPAPAASAALHDSERIWVLKRPSDPGAAARIVAPDRGAGAATGDGPRVIVTTMKNEGPFMLEWVAHNRAIGFTDFLIYTNDCEDGTDAIAARLGALGLAQHRRNPVAPGGSPQRTALRAARGEPLLREAAWLFCADCDEFLNIRAGEGRLEDLFAQVGDAEAVSVGWKLFGNGGHVAYEDGLVTERFTRCLEEDAYPNFRARGMKTLVRPTPRFERLRIHRPAFRLDRGDVKWVDGSGRPMPDSYLEGGWKTHAEFGHDLARLHHYAVRSVDSFLVKRDRGRTNHVGDDQGEAYWATMNYNSAQDATIHARLPMLRAELARLLADDELSRLHAAACDWHRARIAALRQRPGWEAFRARIARINAAPDPEEARAEDVSV